MDTPRDFVSRLAAALAREHADMVEFLFLLAEFHRRRMWVALGHASLFSFLTRELGLSSGAAQCRKTAAELIDRYPEVADALRSGKLCLSSVIELAKVLTPENRDDVLPRFFGLSARDAREVLVSIRPVQHPPTRLVVTPLPPSSVRPAAPAPASPHGTAIGLPTPEGTRQPLLTSEGAQASLLTSEATSARGDAPPAAVLAASPEPAPARPRDEVEPLTATLRRVHVTVSCRFLEKMEAARVALSHSNPGATFEDILEKGLDLVLERHAKRRGLVEKPRPGRAAKATTITAAVKRAVWTRANGRCEWPLANGGVCGSKLRLENAHLFAKTLGGPPTVENLNLHCRFHNELAARMDFGDALVERFKRKGRG